MTSPASRLEPRRTADGSFSLYSAEFQEGFHSEHGARREAEEKFIAPAELSRYSPGGRLLVLDVGLGLGTNAGALFEAAEARGLVLNWFGLELDPQPLALALAQPDFQLSWTAAVAARLEALHHQGQWSDGLGRAQVLWGDARQRLGQLPETLSGQWDLVLLDAFSPRRCPQLWSLEFLGALARLLAPEGRLLTYSSAAAVRQTLLRSGLQLASITPPPEPLGAASPKGTTPWSWGTAASPSPLQPGRVLRPLSLMEREHLLTRAAEPYGDPTGSASAEGVLRARAMAQGQSSAGSTSAWRRRWFGKERPVHR
ncbi:MnmC family methyltransferase [Cyanobium sp. Morenito 9A2]|uniref:MnmC family methyltransferase n=1 Tax=Cyanobium sp. Morenito 9A2 TaxID=2823718 RepID=UPI0020CE5EFF|nr:MnmC family methyltransferase [Cyanobium sp. Morenito 9A2]MCP9849425.1 SAM-dependent methyltransferase [Cyanobium sp. Morenito 9A2]